jgi:lipoprotein NlpI
MTQVNDESNELWRRSLYVVGLSCLYTGDYAGCIASMDKLISLDPDNMDYYLNRGKAHAKAGNESAAAADITKWEKMKEAAATGSSK